MGQTTSEPPQTDSLVATPSKSRPGMLTIPPKEYAALRRTIQQEMEVRKSIPSYALVIAIAKKHGTDLSEWYAKRIYRDLKKICPQLWVPKHPAPRARPKATLNKPPIFEFRPT